MPFIVVSTAGATKRRVKAMRGRVENPEPVWPRVARVVARETRRQFTSRGTHFGTPWRPLTPTYRAWKIAHGYPRSILVQTGELRDSFSLIPMDIEEYFGSRAKFGSSNQKAVWHQYGTHRNGRQVNPARPILFVNPRLEEQVVDVVRRYIVGRPQVVSD